MNHVSRPAVPRATGPAPVLAALSLLPLPLAAQAPEPTVEGEAAGLEPVVVVATREARPVGEVAGNVTVVTRDELDLTLATSLDDVFRYVPGIDAAGAGTRFGTEGLILRGIGGNRVAIELDGIPVSQQFAIGNFSNATRDLLDVGQLQRIEVLHGPASALYGSAALGGVVAISTPRPGDLLPAGERGAFGLAQGLRAVDDSRHTRGFLAGAGEQLGGLASLTRRSGHELEAKAAPRPDTQDYDSTSALGKLAWEDAGGNVLTGLYYGYRSNVETDVRSFLGTGRFASTTRLEGDDDYATDLVSVAYALAGGDWLDGGTVLAWRADTEVVQDTIDERAAARRPVLVERGFEYDQSTTGLSLDLFRAADWGGMTHRLGFGAEYTTSRIEERRDATETGLEDGVASDTVLGETFPLRDFPESVVDEFGVYLHDEVLLGPVRLVAGLRFDRYRLDPDPDPVYLEDNPATTPVAIDRDEFSPKLGVIVPLGDGLDAWAQYAHGFRAPSFEDANIGLDIPLFNIRAIPNPDLRPETSDGLEAGVRWRGGRARVGFTAFYTRYDDFIESKVRLGPDPESGRILFQSRNVAEARIYGAEVAANVNLGDLVRGLSLDAAAAWARGDNRDTDEALNSVGPPQAVLGATWTTPSGRTELGLVGTFTARHSRLDESGGELFEAPGHGLLDLFLTQRFGESLVVRLAVENLLDKTWWRWADVRGLSPDDPLVPALSRPGRGVGVDLGWNF